MQTKRFALATVAAAVLIGTAACGSSSSNTSASPASGSGAKKPVTIGLALSTLNNPFFVQLRDGAQQAADAAGAKLVVVDAQNDAAQQGNQLQNFATQNVGAIVVNAVDSDAAGAMVKAVGAIPVVAVDRGVNGAKVASFVASDNVLGGKLAAQELAARLGGKGEVIVLQGIAGTSASRDRGAGFDQGIAAFPDIKVVGKQPADFDRAKGLDVMTNLLQAHPNVTGVFAENDEMALGALKALGSKAGTGVKVVGFDGTPDGLAAIKAGTMAASVAQVPTDLGKQAVTQAIGAATGGSVKPEVKVEVKVVTKENVSSFE